MNLIVAVRKENKKNEEKVIIVLTSNKAWLERKVKKEEVDENW